jgi:ribonuclease HI
MPKTKYYVVWRGRKTGVFETWADAEKQVKGLPDAQFKAYDTHALAEQALKLGWLRRNDTVPPPAALPAEVLRGYAVDAACNGSPGTLEYQCVRIDSRKRVFHRGPFEQGTNNVGEFLAVVTALAHLMKHSINAAVYTDSVTALAWVRAGKCKTELRQTDANAALFERVAQAEKWLADYPKRNSVFKWQTEIWGENPADFGRK